MKKLLFILLNLFIVTGILVGEESSVSSDVSAELSRISKTVINHTYLYGIGKITNIAITNVYISHFKNKEDVDIFINSLHDEFFEISEKYQWYNILHLSNRIFSTGKDVLTIFATAPFYRKYLSDNTMYRPIDTLKRSEITEYDKYYINEYVSSLEVDVESFFLTRLLDLSQETRRSKSISIIFFDKETFEAPPISLNAAESIVNEFKQRIKSSYNGIVTIENIKLQTGKSTIYVYWDYDIVINEKLFVENKDFYLFKYFHNL